MNLAAVNEATKEMNNTDHVFTENEKNFVVHFAFACGDMDETVEYFAKLNNVKIEVIDKIDKNQDQELVEDLVQIITVFSCKLQGKRKKKTKELLQKTIDEIKVMQ